VFPYRIDMATAEELDADPFSGHGVFLPMPGASGEAILDALEDAFSAVVPAVASPEKGAWINPAGTGLTGDQAIARWDSLHGPGPSCPETR
jgi:hypothetical protein